MRVSEIPKGQLKTGWLGVRRWRRLCWHGLRLRHLIGAAGAEAKTERSFGDQFRSDFPLR